MCGCIYIYTHTHKICVSLSIYLFPNYSTFFGFLVGFNINYSMELLTSDV